MFHEESTWKFLVNLTWTSYLMATFSSLASIVPKQQGQTKKLLEIKNKINYKHNSR